MDELWKRLVFRATSVWRNATYVQSDEKVVHFTRQCGDIFQVWWVRITELVIVS